MVVDSTLDRIKAENTIEIFNYVAYLRTRRTAMVQTEVCHPPLWHSAHPHSERASQGLFCLILFYLLSKKKTKQNKNEARKQNKIIVWIKEPFSEDYFGHQ